MPGQLNHLLYVAQVKDLNTQFQTLSHEGMQDVSDIAEKAVDLASRYLMKNCEEYLEAFNNQSKVFFDRREFEASRSLLMRMVDQIDIDLIDEKEKHIYSSILNNLGVCYFSLSDYTQAAKYMARSYNLKKELRYGYYTMTGLTEDIVYCYINLGQLEKAKFYWSDMTEIAAAEYGKNSYQYLDSLADLFNFLNDNGLSTEADEIDIVYLELESRLNSAKLTGIEYDQAVEDAKQQYDLGNYTLARQIHQQIVSSTTALPEPFSYLSLLGHTLDPLVVYAGELDNTAVALQNSGQIDKPIKLYEEIIEIMKMSLGKENLRVGYALNNLGDAKIAARDFIGAKEALSACLEVMNHPLNRENENRMRMVENYARAVYEHSLDYAPEIDSAEGFSKEFERRNAPEDYARSIRFRMVIPLENEPPVETMIRRFEARRVFYESIGNYSVVLKLLKDIAELHTVYYIFEPEKSIESQLALADAYVFQNDPGNAEKIFLSTLSFVQKNLRFDSFEHLLILHRIGIFYAEVGDHKRACKFIEKALGLGQQLPVRSRELEYQLKKDLIAAYQRKGDETKALIKEILSDFDPEEITDPIDMQVFASYYSQLMELEKAEPLYKKAIAILKEVKGEWDLDYALAISNLANMYRFQKRYNEALSLYQQSLRIREVELGADHPKLIASLARLALTYGALGNGPLAINIVERIISNDDKAISAMTEFGSRDQKLAFLEGISSNTDLCMSVILEFFTTIDGLTDLGLVLVQKRKSILEGMLLSPDLQDAQNESISRASKELIDLRKAIASTSKESSAEFIELASQRISVLEKQLNLKSFVPIDAKGLNQFYNSVDSTTIGLEILKIRKFDFTADLSKGEAEAIDHYIAFVILGANPGQVDLIDLGPSSAIDLEIKKLRDAILQKKDILESVRKLSEWLIEPLSQFIRGAENVIFCPDGDLFLLPFDLLMFEDRPLIERFVVSRSEKLSTFSVSSSVYFPDEVLIIAAPDYFAHQESQSSENITTVFAPLEGALQEGENIAEITGGRLITGAEANKDFFERIKSPVILHIATHAFYGKDFQGFDNIPLLKSGLALSGANSTSDSNVGIISAEEISLMDLKATELVVLSACDTAQGEMIDKEGVFGLEKAFKAAGAKRVIVSLWEVPDKSAALLMKLFYTNLYQGHDVALSLTLAKRNLREKMPNPIYWSPFVLSGNKSGFPLPGE